MVRRHYRCFMALDEAEITTTIIALLNVFYGSRSNGRFFMQPTGGLPVVCVGQTDSCGFNQKTKLVWICGSDLDGSVPGIYSRTGDARPLAPTRSPAPLGCRHRVPTYVLWLKCEQKKRPESRRTPQPKRSEINSPEVLKAGQTTGCSRPS
jgi:hypothetical protein